MFLAFTQVVNCLKIGNPESEMYIEAIEYSKAGLNLRKEMGTMLVVEQGSYSKIQMQDTYNIINYNNGDVLGTDMSGFAMFKKMSGEEKDRNLFITKPANLFGKDEAVQIKTSNGNSCLTVVNSNTGLEGRVDAIKLMTCAVSDSDEPFKRQLFILETDNEPSKLVEYKGYSNQENYFRPASSYLGYNGGFSGYNGGYSGPYSNKSYSRSFNSSSFGSPNSSRKYSTYSSSSRASARRSSSFSR